VSSIEDQLANELGEGDTIQEKQNLIEGTENGHQSLGISVSFDETPLIVKQDHTAKQLDGALMFNVSFPIAKIEAFLASQDWSGDEAEVSDFLTTLIDWNPVIARGIIGSHNAYKDAADQTRVMYQSTEELSESQTILKDILIKKLNVKVQKKESVFLFGKN
jgi:hypothetical protein